MAAAASSLQVTLVGELVVVNATEVPVEFRIAPLAGDVIVTVGIEATVKVTQADPVLPAASVTETQIVCDPGVTGTVGGHETGEPSTVQAAVPDSLVL